MNWAWSSPTKFSCRSLLSQNVEILKVALAGAAGSGKAQLLFALNQALESGGLPAVAVVAYPAALATPAPASYGLTLLMGLETRHRDMQQADQQLRAALASNGSSFQVLYGTSAERLAQAMDLVTARVSQPIQSAALPEADASGRAKPWLWSCDKCSDPQCEHKLLTALLAKRPTAP